MSEDKWEDDSWEDTALDDNYVLMDKSGIEGLHHDCKKTINDRSYRFWSVEASSKYLCNVSIFCHSFILALFICHSLSSYLFCHLLSSYLFCQVLSFFYLAFSASRFISVLGYKYDWARRHSIGCWLAMPKDKGTPNSRLMPMASPIDFPLRRLPCQFRRL